MGSPDPDRADRRAIDASSCRRHGVGAGRRIVERACGRKWRSRARCCTSRRCCCSTSRPPASIRRSLAAVGALLDERRAAGCAILVSTHNLDEAERLADRVAVLHDVCWRSTGRPCCAARLTTGRLIVRVARRAGRAPRYRSPLRSRGGVEGAALVAEGRATPKSETPAIRRARSSRPARGVLEVRPEMPALEDVYLHLMGRLMDGRESEDDAVMTRCERLLAKELLDLSRNRRH